MIGQDKTRGRTPATTPCPSLHHIFPSGRPIPKNQRGIPGNLMNYVGHLERWREAGDRPGTVVVRAES